MMMLRRTTRQYGVVIAIATIFGSQTASAESRRVPHYEIEPLKPVRQTLIGEEPAKSAIFERLAWRARAGGPNAGAELFYLTQVAVTLVKSSGLTPKREVNFYARLTSNNVQTVTRLGGVFLSIRLFDKFGGPLANSLTLSPFNVGCKDNERAVTVPDQTISSPSFVNIFEAVSTLEIANVGNPKGQVDERYLQADGCAD
jgi:hypothetical protein